MHPKGIIRKITALMETLTNHDGTNRTIQRMARKRRTVKAPCSISLLQCSNLKHLSSNPNSHNNNPSSSKIRPLLTRTYRRFHINTTATEDIIQMRAQATTIIITKVRPIQTLRRTCPAVVAPAATTPSNTTCSIYSKLKVSILSHSNSSRNHNNPTTPPSSSNSRMFLLLAILCTIDIR